MLYILANHLHCAVRGKNSCFLHIAEVGRNGGLKMLEQGTYVFLGTDLVVVMFVVSDVLGLVEGFITGQMTLSYPLNGSVLHKLLVFVY